MKTLTPIPLWPISLAAKTIRLQLCPSFSWHQTCFTNLQLSRPATGVSSPPVMPHCTQNLKKKPNKTAPPGPRNQLIRPPNPQLWSSGHCQSRSYRPKARFRCPTATTSNRHSSYLHCLQTGVLLGQLTDQYVPPPTVLPP